MNKEIVYWHSGRGRQQHVILEKLVQVGRARKKYSRVLQCHYYEILKEKENE
ncbi:MAG: hypothetical protein WBL58_03010 [Peptococcia bacterium]|jgi:hypothetical protein